MVYPADAPGDDGELSLRAEYGSVEPGKKISKIGAGNFIDISSGTAGIFQILCIFGN